MCDKSSTLENPAVIVTKLEHWYSGHRVRAVAAGHLLPMKTLNYLPERSILYEYCAECMRKHPDGRMATCANDLTENYCSQIYLSCTPAEMSTILDTFCDAKWEIGIPVARPRPMPGANLNLIELAPAITHDESPARAPQQLLHL